MSSGNGVEERTRLEETSMANKRASLEDTASAVKRLKEVFDCPEDDLYAMLEECDMDINEAAYRLLDLDPFEQAKRKLEKKREGKRISKYRSCGATSNSSQGRKNDTNDQDVDLETSALHNVSESPLHEVTAGDKENESNPSSSLSSVVLSESHDNRESPPLSDHVSAESNRSPSAVQSSTEYYPCEDAPDEVSIDDNVETTGQHADEAPDAPAASDLDFQDPPVSFSDNLPSIDESTVANVISEECTVESQLHQETSGESSDSIDHHSEEENFEERQDDGLPSKGSAPLLILPDHLKLQLADETNLLFGSIVSPLSATFLSASITLLPTATRSQEAEHSPVQAAKSSSLRFGTMNIPYSHETTASVPTETNLEEAHSEADISSGGHQDTRSDASLGRYAHQSTAAVNRTTSQIQNPAITSHFGLQQHADMLPSTTLTSNPHQSDFQYREYSLFPTTSSPIDFITEAWRISGLGPREPTPWALPGTNVTPGPALPQYLAQHPLSHPPSPSPGPIDHSIFSRNTYMPSTFQQPIMDNRRFRPSRASLFQHDRSNPVSRFPGTPIRTGRPSWASPFNAESSNPVSRFPGPPISIGRPPWASLFQHESSNPASRFPGAPINPGTATSRATSTNPHNRNLPLPQQDNSTRWLDGPNSRTIPVGPEITLDNYPIQNQQLGGLRESPRQQSQRGIRSPGSSQELLPQTKFFHNKY